MIERFMVQEDIIKELKNRTGFYQYNLQQVFDELENIIMENMRMATEDEPSEIRLFPGWRIGAKWSPERESKDPRNQELIITPEKVIPYCKIKQSFRNRLNNFKIEEESANEEY